MTITETKWLIYQDVSGQPPYHEKKTKTFFVTPKGSDLRYHLGMVKWYAPWRRYCFFPTPETLYDTDCLHDIAMFIIGLMSDRRMKKLEEKILKS